MARRKKPRGTKTPDGDYDLAPYIPSRKQIWVMAEILRALRDKPPSYYEYPKRTNWLTDNEPQPYVPRLQASQEVRDTCPADGHDLVYHGSNSNHVDHDWWQHQIGGDDADTT